MEPLSPISIPRYSSLNRGRSPAPKFSRAMLPPLSPSMAQPSFIERPESPELIFPMSPVLTDSKETATNLNASPRRVLPIPGSQARRSAPEPILIDLVLQPQGPKALIQPLQDKTTPRAKTKLTSARPTGATPSAQQKLRRQTSSGVARRLVEFLNPTLPSVMATPTAVTVRRSSQADGLSEFVMEEYTLPPLPVRPVSKPVQIKRSKFEQRRDYEPSTFDDMDEEMDLAPTSLPKWSLDRPIGQYNHEYRGSNESSTATRSRPKLSLRKFASHAHLRSSHQGQ